MGLAIVFVMSVTVLFLAWHITLRLIS